MITECRHLKNGVRGLKPPHRRSQEDECLGRPSQDTNWLAAEAGSEQIHDLTAEDAAQGFGFLDCFLDCHYSYNRNLGVAKLWQGLSGSFYYGITAQAACGSGAFEFSGSSQ